MRTFPQDFIPSFLIQNTPPEYPLCIDKEDAILYLNLLLDPEFIYSNFLNFDIIDYEKILYIELTFSKETEIIEKIQQVKEAIVGNYILKNNYIARLKHNIPDIDKQSRENHTAEIHLPPHWLIGLE